MRNCSHPGCTCQLDETRMVLHDGRHYCSDYCASEGLGDAEDCGCGHPGCA